MSTTVDPLTQRIGTHGWFQLRVILIVQFVGVFAGWQILVRLIPIINHLINNLIFSSLAVSSSPRLISGAVLKSLEQREVFVSMIVSRLVRMMISV